MKRRTLVASSLGAALSLTLAKAASAANADDQSQASFDTVMAFMGAMGRGDMTAMSDLMADDMVWHNEGDTTLPWVHGGIQGKDKIFEFLGVFGANLQTTKWENTMRSRPVTRWRSLA